MPGVQARIDKNGNTYYDRKELLIYVLDLQDKALMKNPDSEFLMKRAIDGSHIYYVNGKVVGREHPGVPQAGDDSDSGSDWDCGECLFDAGDEMIQGKSPTTKDRKDGGSKRMKAKSAVAKKKKGGSGKRANGAMPAGKKRR